MSGEPSPGCGRRVRTPPRESTYAATSSMSTVRSPPSDLPGAMSGAMSGSDDGVEHVTVEHVLDRHRARPEDARATLRPGGDDAQVLRRQRQGPAVDDLADAREQVLARLRDAAADHDDRRVQHADARGEDPPERASGLSHGGGRGEVAR